MSCVRPFAIASSNFFCASFFACGSSFLGASVAKNFLNGFHVARNLRRPLETLKIPSNTTQKGEKAWKNEDIETTSSISALLGPLFVFSRLKSASLTALKSAPPRSTFAPHMAFSDLFFLSLKPYSRGKRYEMSSKETRNHHKSPQNSSTGLVAMQ